MLSSDPGLPLGPDDFFLARQLPIERSINLTAESKMVPLRMRGPPADINTMEDEDLLGEKTMEKKMGNQNKNGLSKLT